MKVKLCNLTIKQRREVQNAVKFLRFGKQNAIQGQPPIRCYGTISLALGLPYNQVQHLCRYKSKLSVR